MPRGSKHNVYATMKILSSRKGPAWFGSHAAFLRELLQEPRAVGAVCPSSNALARRMAHWAVSGPTGWVIELGGGTGTVTAALLQRGVPRERLIVVERSLYFVNHLRNRFPGVRIIHGDAADLAHAALSGEPVTSIVSGLPLRSMPAHAVSQVVRGCTRVLNTNSRVIQFTYAPRAGSAWSAAGMHRLANEAVWRNLPPARIEVFTPTTDTPLAKAAQRNADQREF